MTNKHLVALGSFLAAAPAFACGPRFTDTELHVLSWSMLAAPLLAALLVDRGAFALAAYSMGMKRRHAPSAFGPMVAVAAVAIALLSVGARDVHLAVFGFALIPLAAALCSISLLRSVLIDMRGNTAAVLLRVSAIVLFVALALANT